MYCSMAFLQRIFSRRTGKPFSDGICPHSRHKLLVIFWVRFETPVNHGTVELSWYLFYCPPRLISWCFFEVYKNRRIVESSWECKHEMLVAPWQALVFRESCALRNTHWFPVFANDSTWGLFDGSIIFAASTAFEPFELRHVVAALWEHHPLSNCLSNATREKWKERDVEFVRNSRSYSFHSDCRSKSAGA